MAARMHIRHESANTKVQKEYSVLLRNSFTLQRDVCLIVCLITFVVLYLSKFYITYTFSD